MTRSPIATARLRAAATALVLALVAAALLVDYWAQAALPGSTIPLRILELRLAFNRGMAFSLGDSLPVWVVVAVTASITTGLAIYGWRTAPHAGPVTTAALSLVDIYITCGVVLMIGAALFTREATKITPRPAVPDSAES